jgi:putative transposase
MSHCPERAEQMAEELLSQSLSRILVHSIFSTKSREHFIKEAVRPQLHGYMAGIFKGCDSPAIVIGSMEDHAHALFVLSKTWPLCDVIQQVKKDSSKWIKARGLLYKNFHWQDGYGAFSVSESHAEQVMQYIENQREHHQKQSFQNEFRAFLKKYKVSYDERYVWD